MIDPLDLATKAVTASLGSSEENNGYGIDSTERRRDRVVLHSRTCAMWDLARLDAALPDDFFCAAHETFGQELARNIDPSLSFRFGRTLAQGHPGCEWIFNRRIA